MFVIFIIYSTISTSAYPVPDDDNDDDLATAADVVFEPRFALRDYNRRQNFIADYDFDDQQQLHHSDDGFPTVT